MNCYIVLVCVAQCLALHHVTPRVVSCADTLELDVEKLNKKDVNVTPYPLFSICSITLVFRVIFSVIFSLIVIVSWFFNSHNTCTFCRLNRGGGCKGDTLVNHVVIHKQKKNILFYASSESTWTVFRISISWNLERKGIIHFVYPMLAWNSTLMLILQTFVTFLPHFSSNNGTFLGIMGIIVAGHWMNICDKGS